MDIYGLIQKLIEKYSFLSLSLTIYFNSLQTGTIMKNSQNIKKLINQPRSINSNVVGFRVSIEEMDKLKDTQKALKNIGIKGNITNALRVMLSTFDIHMWTKASL